MGAGALRVHSAAWAFKHATFHNCSIPWAARVATTSYSSTSSSSSYSTQKQYSLTPRTSKRPASSQSQAAAAAHRKLPSAAELDIPAPTESSAVFPTASTLLNPPETTRPPPLEVPTRDPSKSLPAHLFSIGKAYLSFYKTGLRNIITNRSLLSSSTAVAPTRLDHNGRAATFPSRADFILRQRSRHDIGRLPVFGLIMLICGEFTPLIVVLFPKLTPYTCRIPKQIDLLRRAAEDRRAASFRNIRGASLATPQLSGAPQKNNKTQAKQQNDFIINDDSLRRLALRHIARTLDLTSRLWDRAGMDSPFAPTLGWRAVRRIAADDQLIRRDGGVGGLIDEEVVLACEDRGINVRGQQTRDLRRRLDEWVRITTRANGGSSSSIDNSGSNDAAREAVCKLLLSEEMILGSSPQKAQAGKA